MNRRGFVRRLLSGLGALVGLGCAGKAVEGRTEPFRDCVFEWDFGDDSGTRTFTEVDRHVFQMSGDYTIHLTVLPPSGMLYGRPFYTRQQMRVMDPPLPPEKE